MGLIRLTLLFGLAGAFFCGCEKRDTAAAPATNVQSSGGNPLTAPVDYLGAAAKAQKSAQRVVSDAGLNQAIKQFYVSEGRFPKDLNELVTQKYLSSLPTPPAGMKFEYNATTGQFKTTPQ